MRSTSALLTGPRDEVVVLVEEMEAEPQKAAPPKSEHYPAYVTTEGERERWDLASAVASDIFGGDGPAAIWSASRAIYHGPLPTTDPSD